MSIDDTYKDIQKLRELFSDEESQSEISSLEKALKKNSLVSNLRSHAGMQIILAEFKQEIELIDKQLLTNVELFKTDQGMINGRVYHARKKWLKKFVAMFDIADTNVRNAEATVKAKLEEKT